MKSLDGTIRLTATGKLLCLWFLLGTPSFFLLGAASPDSTAPCSWTHITGIVRDDDGRMPYAKLAFVGEVWDSGCVATRRDALEATADSLGHYDIRIRAASGALLFAHQDHDRYGGDKPVPVPFGPGDMTVDCNFHSVRVRCVVKGPDGEPAFGTFGYNGCESALASVCGDSLLLRDFRDGTFDAYAPDGGRVNIFTHLGGLPGEPRLSRTFWVKGDTTVTLKYAGLMVRGDLSNHGAPMKGVMVTAKATGVEAWANTDSLGEFVLCVPAGSYRWWIQSDPNLEGSMYHVDRDVDRSRRVRLDFGKAKQKR